MFLLTHGESIQRRCAHSIRPSMAVILLGRRWMARAPIATAVSQSAERMRSVRREPELPVKTRQERETTQKCSEYGERQVEKRHRHACSLADWRQVSGPSLASSLFLSLFLFPSRGSVSICRRLSGQATRRNGRTLSGLRVHARWRAVCWATLSLENACHTDSGSVRGKAMREKERGNVEKRNFSLGARRELESLSPSQRSSFNLRRRYVSLSTACLLPCL